MLASEESRKDGCVDVLFVYSEEGSVEESGIDSANAQSPNAVAGTNDVHAWGVAEHFGNRVDGQVLQVALAENE